MSLPSLQDLAKSLPNECPPLTAIAAMPFPLSMVATRRFYDKDWHKPLPDGRTPGKWEVSITYTTRSEEYFDCDVEAKTEKEAKQKAEALFDKRADCDDEITEIEARFVGGEA